MTRMVQRPAAPSLGAARLLGYHEERGEECRHDQPADAGEGGRDVAILLADHERRGDLTPEWPLQKLLSDRWRGSCLSVVPPTKRLTNASALSATSRQPLSMVSE